VSSGFDKWYTELGTGKACVVIGVADYSRVLPPFAGQGNQCSHIGSVACAWGKRGGGVNKGGGILR